MTRAEWIYVRSQGDFYLLPDVGALQGGELEVIRPSTVALGAKHFHGVFLFGAMYGLKMVCRVRMRMEKRTR